MARGENPDKRRSRVPSFGWLLMSLPLDDETLLERDQTPLPDIDLCLPGQAPDE